MPNHYKFIWFNGKIIPFESATINIMSHVIHYGSGVFEGIKCYKSEPRSSIFRLNEHIERLFESAKIYRINIPFTKEEIIQACIKLVKKCNIKSGYIRPIVYYGYDTLGVHPKDCPVNVSIGIFNWDEYLGKGSLINGVKVTISPWRKFHSSSLPTIAKANGQYLNSLLAVQDAKEKGYDEALLLNQQGTIAEGAGQNIFLVKNNELFTNAEDSSILMGITRKSIIKISQSLNINVNIGHLSIGQLFNSDEAFFCGTASEITPICNVDGRNIANGLPGKLTLKLQKYYLDIVFGRKTKYKKWLTFID